ncbi:MAG TPA: right-handed parallel beta-helix repeat-containing protein [Armatimonadota bacterium]|nr:right-handed parallel beta-helix repeat-containing protein [Armatimonadota bacterium]
MRLTAVILVLTATASVPAATIEVDGFDSSAISAAIEASEAGDTVALPGGEYAITEQILPKSGTHLLGDGQGETLLRAAGDFSGAVIGIHGCENVEVALLSIDGAENAKLNQGISSTNSRGLNLHDITIRNLIAPDIFGPHGIHFNGRNPSREGGVTDSVIADCTLENIGVGASFGSGIRLSWGSSRNQVLRCTINSTGRGGIFGDNGSTDLVITDNVVTGSGGTGLGIEVWGGCDRSVIEDNEIDHWLSIGGCDYCSVRRNIVRSEDGTSKPYGLEIIGSYCIVTDNEVDQTQGIGISVSSTMPKNYHYYADNIIRGCYHWAVQLQGEDGGIAYHYYSRCKFNDTPFGHPSVKYKGGEGNGFRTNGNVKHIVLEDCEFSGNSKYGIQLGGGGVDFLTFIRCAIRDNAAGACVGPGEYTGLNWIDCTVEDNGSDALTEAREYTWEIDACSIEAPGEAKAGVPVTFRALPDDATAMWDFGEGPPVIGAEVTHVFGAPGKRLVTCVAWTDDGQAARVEHIVEVTD